MHKAQLLAAVRENEPALIPRSSKKCMSSAPHCHVKNFATL